MVEIKLTNTRTRTRETFVPLDPQDVRMYLCGPTVYDYAHLGNARPAVVFDVLARLLRTQFHRVVYARNITDNRKIGDISAVVDAEALSFGAPQRIYYPVERRVVFGGVRARF